MENKYLFLALALATLGFIIWYAVSPSLRLPKRFQVQYDINPAYFRRILRRRLAGFILYFLLPYLLIYHWKVLDFQSFDKLGIHFTWNPKVTKWVLILVPLSVVLSWLNVRRVHNLIEYPEIRVTRWNFSLVLISAVTLALYLASLEFLFRGLVLQSILEATDQNEWVAVITSTGLYGMIHYFKNNQISTFAIPFGLAMALVTLDAESILPAILVHVVGGLSIEWMAIHKHPEMQYNFKG